MANGNGHLGETTDDMLSTYRNRCPTRIGQSALRRSDRSSWVRRGGGLPGAFARRVRDLELRSRDDRNLDDSDGDNDDEGQEKSELDDC